MVIFSNRICLIQTSFIPLVAKGTVDHPTSASNICYRVTSVLCMSYCRDRESRAQQNRKLSNCAGSARVPHAFRHRLSTEIINMTTRNPLNVPRVARREEHTS